MNFTKTLAESPESPPQARPSLRSIYDRWFARRRGSKRSRRHKRSPAALVWGFVTFALLQGALAWQLEHDWAWRCDPGFLANLTDLREKQAAHPEAPLVVALGSSRCQFALHWDRIEELTESGNKAVVASFAQRAAGPLTQLVHLRRLLCEGIVPDVLLVEVFSPMFAANYWEAEALPLILPPSTLRGDDIEIASRHAPQWQGSLLWNRCLGLIFPWEVHRSALLFEWAPELIPERFRDDVFESKINSRFRHPDRAEFNADRKAKGVEHNRQGCMPLVTNLSASSPAHRVLEELLDLCRSRHIQVVLVLYPEGPTFRSWYDAAKWQDFQASIEAMAQRHAIPLVNAREWASEEDFFDSHHLFADGADRFTRRLWEDTLAPMVDGRNARVPLSDP